VENSTLDCVPTVLADMVNSFISCLMCAVQRRNRTASSYTCHVSIIYQT